MQFRKWFGAFSACLFAWAIAHVSTAMAISQTQVLEAECDPSFNVFVVFKPVESWSADAQVQFRINFQHQRGGYVVRVTPSSVILFKVAGSNQQRLARSALPAFTRKHRWELTVQRRNGADRYRIAVLVNGSPIIAINDSTFRAGRAEYNATRLEIFIKPPRYQPIEPIYFMDDFTRAPDEPSLWNVVKGSWQVGHLMQAFTSRRRMLASERTSNPFAYIATPADDGIALAVSGYWFWESYTLDAAVRPDGNGIIGLIVFYQNPQSYLMLRWASQHASKDGDAQGAGARKAKSHKPSCELVWVVNGQERIVSRAPGGYEAGQWYRLTLRANCEKVEA
ncbi:MAG TPA: hypothetical protein EYP10_03460, partial [Armatimonadetes bacterium]|nr:hypothetical protein [Armatimonadota bacterium]